MADTPKIIFKGPGFDESVKDPGTTMETISVSEEDKARMVKAVLGLRPYFESQDLSPEAAFVCAMIFMDGLKRDFGFDSVALAKND